MYVACGLYRETYVCAQVVDLPGFINAAPEDFILVESDGKSYYVKKGEVVWDDIRSN